MRRSILLLHALILAGVAAFGQEIISGRVIDADTKEPVRSVHVIAHGYKLSGSVTNAEGEFELQHGREIDSIRVSCVGYATTVLYKASFTQDPITIALKPFVTHLETLTIKPPSPQDLIRSAVRDIPVNYTTQPFQVRGFYREQIQNDSAYYSVAEAVFESQLYPGRKGDYRCLMKLIQGRRSETVRSTRMFEDYHPGGGPNYLMNNVLEVELPEFLDPSHFNEYEYSVDSITSYDSRDVYMIVFDQRESVKKNLWKGRLFIDAESFAIIELTYGLSEKGIAYRKHLTGKDKTLAQLLGIDFVVNRREARYSYHHAGTRWSLHEARLSMDIHFTQPRKKIDEQFNFSAEMLALSEKKDSLDPFSKNELWHRNQLVKNLPGEFDDGFWGPDNYIKPDQSLTAAVASMNLLDTGTKSGLPQGWNLLHPSSAKAYTRDSTILLKPYVESRWKDTEQGPFLWKEMTGDFQIYTRLKVTRATDTLSAPDAGFQVGGLMVRAESTAQENHLLFGIGCMGNPALKIVSQNTINGNSAIHVTKIEQNELYIMLRRTGDKFELLYSDGHLTPGPSPKRRGEIRFELLRQVTRKDMPSKLQIGIAGFSSFPGNAPNRRPDILIQARSLYITPGKK